MELVCKKQDGALGREILLFMMWKTMVFILVMSFMICVLNCFLKSLFIKVGVLIIGILRNTILGLLIFMCGGSNVK